MEKLHNITEITFENDFLIIKIDGQLLKLTISEVSKKLASASADEKNEFLISPSGYGIHWPKIDEDISVSYLLSK